MAKSSSRTRITERRLVDVLISHLRQETAVAREVRHYEKRIDLVFVDPASGDVCAIEAKTEAWARAIGQAVVNLAVAHKSYIAIYSEHVHRVPRDLLEKHGIGLISVGTSWGDVDILVQPPDSPYQNKLLLERLRRSVLGEPALG